MVEHVYRRAAQARGIDAVVVATDDPRIASAVQGFGGIARLTRRTHQTGTDRIAEVAADLPCDLVVNVQGDEPLIEPGTIEAVLEPLDSDPDLGICTACRPITAPDDYDNPGVVKVVRDVKGNALYFSRTAIPFRRVARNLENGSRGRTHGYKHIGLYAFRRRLLLRLAGLPQTPLEIAESLEQLRALEHGIPIQMIETQFDSIGVDTPDDLEQVRRRLAVTVPSGAATSVARHATGEVA